MAESLFLPMHVKALGFTRNPFPYTPDAFSYFHTPHIEQQFAELTHCILDRKGFFLLTADIGLGKSTLVRRLIMQMQQDSVRCALVVNTFLQGSELLSAIVSDFALPATGDLYQDHKTLNEFLLTMHRAGTTCLVVIDDAQNLSKSSLEMIRLLSNLETDQEKLVQILLVGQQELDMALSSNDLRQLRSRIANHVKLKALTLEESIDYVGFRLHAAGAGSKRATTQPLIDRKAGEMLWHASRGVPRSMHVILDRCLYGLLMRGEHTIDLATVLQAIADTQNLRDGYQQESEQETDRRQYSASKVAGGQQAKNSPAKRPAALMASLVAMGIFAVFYLGSKLETYPGFDSVVGSSARATSGPVAAREAASPVTPFVTSLVAPQGRIAPDEALSLIAVQKPVAAAMLPVSAGRGAVTLCNTSSSPVLAASQNDAPVQQARITEKTWSLIGQKLRPHVQPCFDEARNDYQISWRAPHASSALPAGREVARYQIGLSNFGSLRPSEVDGIYGSRTIDAIKAMQSSVGIEVTGRFDPLTVLVLNDVFIT